MPRGFTLIELLVGAGDRRDQCTRCWSACRCAGTSGAELKGAARTLASGLRQAQSTALATRRDATLTLDLDSREFEVSGTQGARSLPRDLELKLFTAQTEVATRRRARSVSIRTAARPAGASPWPRASASTWWTWTGSPAAFPSTSSHAQPPVGFHPHRGRGRLRAALARPRHGLRDLHRGHAPRHRPRGPGARADGRAIAASRARAPSRPWPEGQSQGETADRKHRWTLTIAPSQEGIADPSQPLPNLLHSLYRVDASVRWRGADERERSVELVTLRLGPKK